MPLLDEHIGELLADDDIGGRVDLPFHRTGLRVKIGNISDRKIGRAHV
jgi:hypothetical protein